MDGPLPLSKPLQSLHSVDIAQWALPLSSNSAPIPPSRKRCRSRRLRGRMWSSLVTSLTKKWSRWIHREEGLGGMFVLLAQPWLLWWPGASEAGGNLPEEARALLPVLWRGLFCRADGPVEGVSDVTGDFQRYLSGGLNRFLQGDSPVNHCLPGQGAPPSQGKITFLYSSLWEIILKILTVSRRVPYEPPLLNRSLRNQHGQQLQEKCCKGRMKMQYGSILLNVFVLDPKNVRGINENVTLS